MHTVLVLIALCQTADLAPPSRGNSTAWNKSVDVHSNRLAKLTHDAKFTELKTELSRLQTLYSKSSHEGDEIVAMSAFLNAIVLEDGYEHVVDVRTVCLPFAEGVVTKSLSMPAAPDLHEAQILAYVNVLDHTGTEVGRASIKADDKLRKERVGMLVTIWHRLVQSKQFYAKEFPPKLIAEINSGATSLEMPRLPESLEKVPLLAGQSLDGIKDPVIRKEYKAYLDRRQATHTRFIAASGLIDLDRYLPRIRKSLEVLYGKDREAWNELRDIIASTVEDQELAEQIRKDLTLTKQP